MTVQFTVDSFICSDQTSLRYGLMRTEKTVGNCPVVFVPGLGGSVKNALTFLERFVPNHGPVYSMDARGFGLNEEVLPKPRPADYLKDFNEFIHHLQQFGQFGENCSPIIVGISLGGVYTTLYLTQYAHPFKGAILLAPAFRPNPLLFTWHYKMKNYLQMLMKGTRAITVLPYGIRDLTRNHELYDDPNFTDPLALPAAYLLMIEMMCNKAFNRVKALNIPTAIIVPEKDFVCDPNAMKMAYDRIPHPQKVLFTYTDLYHDVVQEPEEDQHRLFTDLASWIGSLNIVTSRQPSHSASVS